MFKSESNKKLCETVLHEVAKRHKKEITELSVMSDHIHVVVCNPSDDEHLQSVTVVERGICS